MHEKYSPLLNAPQEIFKNIEKERKYNKIKISVNVIFIL